ncbi:site-specific integrase [Bacillus sp. FJAT-26390]|uniref:site-specific integrase n=1 Tax=Bacillus sp. FJAT-26390 TaxID=1743142 RepID=UPI000807F782|nr:site-specific integrase [Bacillus sp. FJAT-26390]OBZ10876.1 hypothetical protein A7975_17895 [Bacillus sp. FJAT-26390]
MSEELLACLSANILRHLPDQQTFTGFRDFVMLSLILDCGLRVGELTKLKMNQVDVKESQLLGGIG